MRVRDLLNDLGVPKEHINQLGEDHLDRLVLLGSLPGPSNKHKALWTVDIDMVYVHGVDGTGEVYKESDTDHQEEVYSTRARKAVVLWP